MTLARKTRVFWPLLLVVLLSDCTTKRVAVASLESPGASQQVLGETVRFTLVYNEGAAMGLLGPWAKELLGVFSLVAAAFFFAWYHKAPPEATALGAATALVMAGALGNGWQRLLAPGGVVDFIDVGIGAHRFWVFNVADVAVNLGAILLLLVLMRETRMQAGSVPATRGRMS
jgi:signal peptidase II